MSSVLHAQSASENQYSSGCLFTLVLFLPFLLDTCVNRDPNLYVDEHYRLVAISPSQPKSLIYERPMPPNRWIEGINDVTDVRIAKRVIAGKAMHPPGQAFQSSRYFIVNRSTDEQFFFESEASQNEALTRAFGTDPGDLKPVNVNYAWIRGNWLYPYNLIYYGAALIGLGIYSCRRWRRRQNAKQTCE